MDAKAPIIQHFSETIARSMSIRQQERFVQENFECVDQNLKMDFHNNATNVWIGFWLESIGTLILCIAASVLVFLPSNLIQPSLVLILEVSIFLTLHCILLFHTQF